MRSPPLVRHVISPIIIATIASLLALAAFAPTSLAAPPSSHPTAATAVLPSFAATTRTSLCADVASSQAPTLLSIILGSQEVYMTRSNASTRPVVFVRIVGDQDLKEDSFPAWYAGYLRPQFGLTSALPESIGSILEVRDAVIIGDRSSELENVADAQQPIPHQRE